MSSNEVNSLGGNSSISYYKSFHFLTTWSFLGLTKFIKKNNIYNTKLVLLNLILYIYFLIICLFCIENVNIFFDKLGQILKSNDL